MAIALILTLYAIIGLMAVAGSIYLSQRFVAPRFESMVFGLFLIAIACFYLIFAWHFADSGAWPLEVSAVLIFAVLGALGTRVPLLLILGYALHGVWDLLHEIYFHTGADPFSGRVPSQIPLAYGVFCASYDWGMASYFYLRRSKWSSVAPSGAS